MKTIEEIKIDLTLKVLAGDLDGYSWGDLPVDDSLRTFVCGLGSSAALSFATEVDKGPHNETRKGVSGDPACSMLYALEVDRGPHDDTRKACCMDAEYSLKYAECVDKCPREDTRAGAYNDQFCKRLYIKVFENYPLNKRPPRPIS